MLEQLLGGSSPPGFIAASGPGPKTLKSGNMQLGYFGQVTSGVLFQGWELFTASGLEVGNDVSTGMFWLKFAYKGKILYIASQQIRLLVGWTDLYNCGVVYGDKNYGTYPIGSPGVMQYKVMQKVESGVPYYLFPRLMTGFTADPQPAAPTQAVIDDSEYSQLLARCITGANGNIVDKFDTLTVAQGSYASQMACWTKETLSTDVNSGMMRGNATSMGVAQNFLKTYVASNAAGWRPVLELIPPSALKDPFNVLNTPVGAQAPSILDMRTAQAMTTGQALLDPRNVVTLWPTKQPAISGYVITATAVQPQNVTGSSNVALNPFTINGTYTP